MVPLSPQICRGPSFCGALTPRWLHRYPLSGCGHLYRGTSRPIQIRRRTTRLSTIVIFCDLLDPHSLSLFPVHRSSAKICNQLVQEEDDEETLNGTSNSGITIRLEVRTLFLNPSLWKREAWIAKSIIFNKKPLRRPKLRACSVFHPVDAKITSKYISMHASSQFFSSFFAVASLSSLRKQ